ncbi:hypothetical protein ACFPRL_10320 [Pseudoclavibacter helvolus]
MGSSGCPRHSMERKARITQPLLIALGQRQCHAAGVSGMPRDARSGSGAGNADPACNTQRTSVPPCPSFIRRGARRVVETGTSPWFLTTQR